MSLFESIIMVAVVIFISIITSILNTITIILILIITIIIINAITIVIGTGVVLVSWKGVLGGGWARHIGEPCLPSVSFVELNTTEVPMTQTVRPGSLSFRVSPRDLVLLRRPRPCRRHADPFHTIERVIAPKRSTCRR